ncbi:hypothetical protein OROHE_000208 [Orobanche hederae]
MGFWRGAIKAKDFMNKHDRTFYYRVTVLGFYSVAGTALWIASGPADDERSYSYRLREW